MTASALALPPLRTRLRTPGFAMLAICFAQALVLLDTTVINIAFAEMMRGLHASVEQMLWITNSYLVSYAVLLVPGGRLGDLFGMRRVMLVGLAVFTVASAACGFAQHPEQVIVGRAVQGVGAALLAAQAMAIITRVYPAEQRGRALGVWGAFAGLATAAGPTVGGLLAATVGWRGIFFINLPVGLIGAVLVLLAVPRLRAEVRSRLDVTGALLLAAAIFLVVYPLISGERYGWGRVWGPVTIPMLFAAAVVVLGVFALVQWHQQGRDPLLPFALLRDRNFAIASAVIGVIPGAVAAMLLLIPLYLQTAHRWSAFQAGLLIAVPPFVSVVVARRSGRLSDRWGGKYVLMLGLLLFGLGMAMQLMGVGAHRSWLLLLPGLAVTGVGMGVAFAPSVAVAMRDVPPQFAGVASGVFNTTRLCGSLVYTASVGALLQVFLSRGDIFLAVRNTYAIPVLTLLAGALATMAVRQRKDTV
ncbi:MFS transporter [Planosporangium sp. 12N6]|uniref:MFS transporter n=1 Tax=Planosporangium spinosum TaxID=3402278 RepID=UPI003CE912C6